MKKTPYRGNNTSLNITDRKKVSLTIISALCHFTEGEDVR